MVDEDDFGYLQEIIVDTGGWIYAATLELPVDADDAMKEAVADAGFDPEYAYCVRDVKEVDGTKLIQLFHPDDDFTWAGDFGRESDRWTPELKEACNFDPEREPDGCFWMEFDQAIGLWPKLNFGKVDNGHRAVTETCEIEKDVKRSLFVLANVVESEICVSI